MLRSAAESLIARSGHGPAPSDTPASAPTSAPTSAFAASPLRPRPPVPLTAASPPPAKTSSRAIVAVALHCSIRVRRGAGRRGNGPGLMPVGGEQVAQVVLRSISDVWRAMIGRVVGLERRDARRAVVVGAAPGTSSGARRRRPKSAINALAHPTSPQVGCARTPAPRRMRASTFESVEEAAWRLVHFSRAPRRPRMATTERGIAGRRFIAASRSHVRASNDCARGPAADRPPERLLEGLRHHVLCPA